MAAASKPVAPASSKISALALFTTFGGPAAVAAAGLAMWKINWKVFLTHFFTGPGRLSRILMLLFAILNWKNMPFAWTGRLFYPVYYHHFLRRSPQLGPRALFAPIISGSRAPLLEIDYNVHKSNSTYFADADVSRTHLVSNICGPGIRAAFYNPKTQIVMDPTTGKPAMGSFSMALGSAHCSFHKEIGPYGGYEMWTRVLAWDRKWLYTVTHFVKKGAGRPSEWLDPKFRRNNRSAGQEPVKDWERKVHATAVGKYVFKLGRLTVHPAIILQESGLLPERPGGWVVDDASPAEDAPPVEELPDGDLFSQVEGDDKEWDWRRVEQRRRAGMEYAGRFQAMDQLREMFDGGRGPVLGRFGPG